MSPSSNLTTRTRQRVLAQLALMASGTINKAEAEAKVDAILRDAFDEVARARAHKARCES